MNRIEPRIDHVFLFILGLALVLLPGACQKSAVDSQCRAPYFRNDETANRLWHRLESSKESAALIARRTANPPVCFAQVDISVVTTDGMVLLDNRLGDDENAARLGHLLLHVLEGHPLGAKDAGDCRELVEKALRVEAGALALEMRLRREFRVTRKTYEFEDEFWSAGPDGRERLVLNYLQMHPEGAPGIDKLGAGYLKQCREQKM